MEYSKFKNFLKTNLYQATLDFQWSDKCNEKFFAFVEENFGKDYLQSPQAVSEVKHAFIEHFESIGHVQFKLENNNIELNILPYTIDPQESAHIDDIIDIIDENDEMIDYEYNGREDHISIPKKLKNKILNFVEHIEEEVNKKELIRYSVREAFELKESDIVVIKKDQIFIKIYDDSKRKKVSDEEKNTIAGRFNGLDEDELEDFYIECSFDKENKDFFLLIAELYFDKYFKEEKIDNHTYEQRVFSDITTIITEQLTNSFDHNEEFFKGFSGYLFRRHFKEVFEHIVDMILHQLSISNQYMIEFLKYYSLNTVLINGVRYRIPTLEAKNGLKWNAVSMLSVAKVYTKLDLSRKQTKIDIEDVNAKMLNLYISGLPPMEYQNLISQKRKELEDEINQANKQREKLYTSFNNAQDPQAKERITKEMNYLETNLNILIQKRSSLASKVVKKSILKDYINLEKQKESLTMRLKKDQRILSQNEDSYQSIKHALVKALISKKQRA